MLKGTCPKCGECYYGFALVNPVNQACGNCGTALEITNGYKTFTGFSPLADKKVEEDSTDKKTRTDDTEESSPNGDFVANFEKMYCNPS